MSVDRKIDVNKLSNDELEKTIQVLGDQIRNDVDALCEKYNKKLNRYGLACKLGVHILENED